MSVRLLAGLLAVGLLVAACPVGAIPARAVEKPAGTLLINGGVTLDSDMDKANVRTITFQNSKPTGAKCWNAGDRSKSSVATNDTVIGCATASGESAGMWDVTYGADSMYPKLPNNLSAMFAEFTGLVSINNLDKLDTSNVTNMNWMFYKCSSLESVDVTRFDTSNVTSMYGMFWGCSLLKTLDLTSFDTSKVEVGGTGDMFEDLESLEEVRVGEKFVGEVPLDRPNSKATREGYDNLGKWRNMETGELYKGYATFNDDVLPYAPEGGVNAVYTPFGHLEDYQITIKYDANGGTGEMADTTYPIWAARTYTDYNTFTRDGYEFTGWNTKADGTGTAYPDHVTLGNPNSTNGANETYVLPSCDAGDVTTLYAQWEKPRTLTRLSGQGRYDTMSRIVQQAYPDTASTVIVASGANYPDALAASGLSGVLDAPIVLTDPNELSTQATEQLNRLNPKTIIIAGGAGAVSDTVGTRLEKYGTVTRLSGASRYDTSYQLYEQGGDKWGDTAIVATGASYADALSVSSYAYAAKAPVFLCDPNTGLTGQQQTALNGFEKVIVVGGNAAVPDTFVQNLPNVTRLAGNGRYDTSRQITEWAIQNGGLTMNGAVYATGENFPDALASAPLAGVNNAPILLVNDEKSTTVDYSAQFNGQVSKAYIVGGEGAVNATTATTLADKLGLKLA